MPRGQGKATRSAKLADLRIDIDLDVAAREAARVRSWLESLRQRHDLARFEFTRHVRIVPASRTYSHPILTLGTRFTETEDQLLATYLHEQMHWYLYLLDGLDHDPIAPFFDELVRRYPDAPTRLPEGARNYEQTYTHIVINWLELYATSQFIGRARAAALAETQYGYRWIYRTVLRDWDRIAALLEKHSILPIKSPQELAPARGASRRRRSPADLTATVATERPPPRAPRRLRKRPAAPAASKKIRAAAPAPRARKARRRRPARDGRSAG